MSIINDLWSREAVDENLSGIDFRGRGIIQKKVQTRRFDAEYT